MSDDFQGLIGNNAWVPDAFIWTIITWTAFIYWFFRYNSKIEPYVQPAILNPRFFTIILILGLVSGFLPGALSQGSLFLFSPFLIPLSVFFLPLMMISSPFGIVGFVLIYSVLLRNAHNARICLKERLIENNWSKFADTMSNPFPVFYRFVFALFPLPLYMLFVGKATKVGKVEIPDGLLDIDSIKLIFSAMIVYPPVAVLLITRSFEQFFLVLIVLSLFYAFQAAFFTFFSIMGFKKSDIGSLPVWLKKLKVSPEKGLTEGIGDAETASKGSVKECPSCDTKNSSDAIECGKCGFNLKDVP